MSFIRSTGLNCKATHSCSNTSIQVGNADTFCYGIHSCSSSNITMLKTNNTHTLWCIGEQSCAYSIIYAINKVHAGAYSLYFANISSSDYSLTVRLNGALAGYGARLKCQLDHVCKIYCDGHNSCYMFYIECVGTCKINLASNDVIPPFTDIVSVPKLYLNTTNTDALCNTHPKALIWDNKSEHDGIDIIVQSGDEAPICCRGDHSCSSINVMEYESSNTQSVICSGGFACSESNINVNHGSVFCEAGDACKLSQIRNASYLYCSGYKGCASSIIRATRRIQCSGQISCQDTFIHSDGTDLFIDFTGNRAGLRAMVYCNQTDYCHVRCIAEASCSETYLFCNGVCTVQCNVSSGCPMDWTPSINTTTYQSTSARPTLMPTSASFKTTALPVIPRTTLPNMYPSYNPSLPQTETSQPTHETTTNLTVAIYTSPDMTNTVGRDEETVQHPLAFVLIGIGLLFVCIVLGIVYWKKSVDKTNKTCTNLSVANTKKAQTTELHNAGSTILYNQEGCPNTNVTVGSATFHDIHNVKLVMQGSVKMTKGGTHGESRHGVDVTRAKSGIMSKSDNVGAGNNELQRCADCACVKIGNVFKDGLFYCTDCSQYYESEDDNEDLFDVAPKETPCAGGENHE
eukprot:751440_1